MLHQTEIVTAPGTAEEHFRRAEELESAGCLQAAASAWIEGIEIDATKLRPHLRLAEALYQLGMLDECVTAYRHALLVDPKHGPAYSRLGSLLELMGDRGRAIDCYSQYLNIDPKSAKIRQRLACLLRADGNLGSARTLLEDLIRQHPDHAGHRFDLAGVLSEMGASEDAIRELRKALKVQPNFPEALNNLALLVRANGDLAEAERCLLKAVSQNSRYAAAWNNLGNVNIERSRLGEAERCYNRAIATDPNYAEAHTNLGLLMLLEGKFTDGWAEFEWRWKRPGVTRPVTSKPAWDGSSPEGRTILLYSEQGAGDTIQFIRYARLLRDQGANVIVRCQQSLASLIGTSPGVKSVVSGNDPIPDFDVHAPLMSLPRLFQTTEATIPAEASYLSVPAGAVVPPPLRAATGLRVGLVWAGNPEHRNDRNRSISPKFLMPWLNLKNVSFFSLQVGPSARPPQGVVDLSAYLKNYGATAASIKEMDLIISVDTSVAHLAGALGTPVWALLPTCNDWRWLQERSDSPWYPSMRLFRQPRLGDWETVIDCVKQNLSKKIGEGNSVQ